jgi:hypothetical protein
MYSALPLVTTLWLAAAEDPKPDVPPPAVQAVIDGYLKAVAAKDLDAMGKLADVPWLDRDRQMVRDPAGLRKAMERVVAQLPKATGKRKVEAFSYKKLREKTKDEAERKLLDEVLGEDGYFVFVEDDGDVLAERQILIRWKGGKAAVVAGPLKPNQLSPQNRIPEEADQLLGKADTFELYSLDPQRPVDGEGKVVPPKDSFHGWKVLGKTLVKADAERKLLADALRLGAEDNFGVVAACFIPRHGIRLTGGGKTIDMVICFQCLSVQVFVDDKGAKGFLTTGEPQKEFDKVLKAAGVKLPEAAKEK